MQGMGLRTALAENYTAVRRQVNAIVMHIDLQDDIQATDDVVEEANMGQPEEKQIVESDPIRSNKALRPKVGGRAVEYVQRLRKNLGHCGANVLTRMLREVQATDDALRLPRSTCVPYAMPERGQSKLHQHTEFNDRLQVDSHWILNEDSTVKVHQPAPGTPAAERKERRKPEKFLRGDDVF